MTNWGRRRAESSAQTVRSKTTDGFGTVRLVAAFFIIIDHAAPLTKSGGSILPSKLGVDLGAVTVSAFMAMSGYLVTRSWQQDPHLWRFAVKRAMRIMPGLIVMTALTVLVLGPVLTTLATGAYFGHPATSTYFWNNIRIFPIQYTLPGVFKDNLYPGAINGSLWSMPVEVLGYAMIAVLGLVGAVRRRWMVVIAALAFAVLFQRMVTKQIVLPKLLLMVPALPLIQYLTVYCVGMLAWLYRDRIKYTWVGIALCAGIDLVFYASSMIEVVRLVTVPYVVLAIGTLMPRRLWLPSWLTMSSYGVYLYGFPTEQFVVHMGATSKYWVALISVPIAFALGLASWHLVESPVQKLRRHLYFSKRKPAAPVETPPAEAPPAREPARVD